MVFEKKDGKIKGDFSKLKDGKYIAKEIKTTRSVELNRYYWVCINYIVEEYQNYGYIHTSDFLHRQFRKCFLPKKRVKSDFTKGYIYQSTSTTELNNKEFVKYLTNIKLICEFGKLGEINKLEEIGGFILPNPEERELYNYIDKQNKKNDII